MDKNIIKTIRKSKTKIGIIIGIIIVALGIYKGKQINDFNKMINEYKEDFSSKNTVIMGNPWTNTMYINQSLGEKYKSDQWSDNYSKNLWSEIIDYYQDDYASLHNYLKLIYKLEPKVVESIHDSDGKLLLTVKNGKITYNIREN